MHVVDCGAGPDSMLFLLWTISVVGEPASQQVFREEMDLEPFLSKDHDLVVPKACLFSQKAGHCVCASCGKSSQRLLLLSLKHGIRTIMLRIVCQSVCCRPWKTT